MSNNLSIQITSRKRSGNTLNALKEIAEQKAKELEKTELNTKKALVENLTKRKASSTRLSTRKVNEKVSNYQKNLINTKDYFITECVRKALPFDLSNISDEELLEQIKLVKEDIFSGVISENKLLEPTYIKNTLTEESNILVDIGAAQGVNTPLKLAKGVLAANATLLSNCDKCVDDTGRSLAINILDTAVMYGDASEKLAQPKKLKDFVTAKNSQLLINDITTRFSEQVKITVADNILTDKRQREFQETRYENLSESTTQLRQLQDRRKQQHYSLLEELFKNASVLQESYGAEKVDYMNEAVFQLTILETYRLLECVEKDNTQIIVSLRSKRKNLSN